MSSYRRRHVPGGTYFFTVRVQKSGSDLLIREIDLFTPRDMAMPKTPAVHD